MFYFTVSSPLQLTAYYGFYRRSKLFRCSHIAQSTGIPTPVLEKFEKGTLRPTNQQIALIERVIGLPLIRRPACSFRRV